MRKFFKYNIIGLAVLMLGIVSCDTAEQEVSPIVEPDDSYPLITYTLENAGTTLAEGDTIVYTITINKPISTALTFNIKVDAELTTVDGDDYKVEAGVIQAWTTSTQLKIYTNWDITPEANEVLAFEMGLYSLAVKYLVHPDNVNPTASFTVNNYTSDEVMMDIHWDTGVDLGFGVYSAGTYLDFDIFMSPGATYDAADPWASVDYTYYAATGSEPEEFVLTGAADGVYVFWFDLWANVFASYGVATPVPLTAHVYQPGVFDLYVDQDPATVVTADTPGVADDGTVSNGTIVKVTVASGVYTVTNYADVAQGGKSTSEKTPRSTSFVKTF